MFKKLKRWWQAEGDLVRLRGVDDRLLADMGLKRDALRDHVHGTPVAQRASAGKEVVVRAPC